MTLSPLILGKKITDKIINNFRYSLKSLHFTVNIYKKSLM